MKLLTSLDEDEDLQENKYLTFHLANEDYGVEIIPSKSPGACYQSKAANHS